MANEDHEIGTTPPEPVKRKPGRPKKTGKRNYLKWICVLFVAAGLKCAMVGD